MSVSNRNEHDTMRLKMRMRELALLSSTMIIVDTASTSSCSHQSTLR